MQCIKYIGKLKIKTTARINYYLSKEIRLEISFLYLSTIFTHNLYFMETQCKNVNSIIQYHKMFSKESYEFLS